MIYGRVYKRQKFVYFWKNKYLQFYGDTADTGTWKWEGGCCVIVYIVGDFTCEYLSGCGRYHFADMILEKIKKVLAIFIH